MAGIVETLRANREAAMRIANKIGSVKTQAMLKRAEVDLIGRLAEVRSGPGSFTETQLKATLSQVRDALREIVLPGIRDVVVGGAEEAAGTAARGTVDYLNAAERAFKGVGAAPLALDEARVMDAAVVGARASVLRRLASSGKPSVTGDTHPAAKGILQRYGINVIGRFEEELRVGLVARSSFDDVKAKLIGASPFLKGAPASWATRIAVTETLGAHSRAGYEATQEADEQLGDLIRVDMATFDARTGCLVGSSRIASDMVRAIFRRPYEGRVFRLITKAGRDFTTTPNHPMLTRRGWIRADRLQLGDELICDSRQERSRTSGQKHAADSPPTIAEVFEAVSKVGIVERRAGRQEDFHGDGMQGDVDVLRPDRELRLGFFTAIDKPAAKEIFTPSDDVLFCSKCSALLGFDASEELIRLRARTLFHASFGQALLDEGLGCAEASSDALDRLAALFIAGCDLHDGESLPVLGMRGRGETMLRSGRTRSRKASLFEGFADVSKVGVHRCSHLLHRQSGGIELDRLIDIQVTLFCGHVFNLSTEDGYFTVEGAYTSNCDSYNLHGSVRRTDEPFEYITSDGGSQFFLHPPDRPFDRSVIVTHRTSWGPLPKSLLALSDGAVVAAYKRAKQTFYRRPLLSTVPGY